MTAARLLEERLIVIETDAVDTEDVGRRLGEPLGEDEALGRLVDAPQVGALEEGLAVGVALLERSGLAVAALRGVGDVGLVGADLLRRRQAAHHGVALRVELLERWCRNLERLVEVGQRVLHSQLGHARKG